MYNLGVSTEVTPVFKAVVVILIVAIQAPPVKAWFNKRSAAKAAAKKEVATRMSKRPANAMTSAAAVPSMVNTLLLLITIVLCSFCSTPAAASPTPSRGLLTRVQTFLNVLRSAAPA